MTGAREEDIAHAEAAVGARLPDWLRERLLAENGFVLDDTAGVTSSRWQILPVLDRSDRKRMTATAEHLVRHTTLARAVDRVSTPGFGEPKPGHPFPADGVVIGYGSSSVERLALLPDPADPTRLGLHLYRQMMFAPIAPLGVLLTDFAPEPASFETGEPLPVFRYHPDPIATGSIHRSGNTCGVCGKARGWVYVSTPYGRDTINNVCPWCIADGSAAARGASFSDDYPLIEGGVPADVVDEVTLRTPGMITWQQEIWQHCCGDACVYDGELTPAQIVGLPTELQNELGLAPDLIDDIRGYDGELAFSVFSFHCRHCGTQKAFLDMS